MIAHRLDEPPRPRPYVVTGQWGRWRPGGHSVGLVLALLVLAAAVGLALALTLGRSAASPATADAHWTVFRHVMLAWMARSSRLG